MIDEKIKASAIARMRRKVPLDEIAEDLGLPLMVLKEWHSRLDFKDLVQIEANTFALETVLEGEVLDPTTKEILKDKLEELALDITKQISYNLASGDVVYAKSLQLYTDAVMKLHTTFIGQNTPGAAGLSNNPNSNGLTIFGNMMKD